MRTLAILIPLLLTNLFGYAQSNSPNPSGDSLSPMELNLLNLKNMEANLESMVGQPAPAFALLTTNGDSLRLTDFRGQVVLLDFWEHWCKPCIEKLPSTEAMYQELNAEGLQVVGLVHTQGQDKAALKIMDRKGITFPVVWGTKETKEDYFNFAVPVYILIDREGIVRFASLGYDGRLTRKAKALLKE